MTHTDALSGRARTWPYGTQKRVTILEVDARHNMTICVSDDQEGFVLLGGDHAIAPMIGAMVVIQFCQGGPMGGYWKIVRRSEG
jgi:hypothetical protein